MKKILVIDDAQYILESTSTLLGFEGFETLTSDNGFDGVEKAINEIPDMIVCDISMPGMDGYEVLEEIRKNEKTKTIPFIFLTAFTDKTNMRAGMERGADDYLFKPFTRDELLAAIEAQFKKNNIINEHYQDKIDELCKNITTALPHEFRTVLNQIIGNSGLLKSSSNSLTQTEISEISDDIYQSAKRLLKISENYLVYAQIATFEKNKVSTEQLKSFENKEPCSILIDLAQKISADYSRSEDLIINKIVNNITISISAENFDKILKEVLDNAFRFSEIGTEVTINTELVNQSLKVSVTDKGRGLTNVQINKIGAYMQFDRKVYEQQGVGLGLSIAKKLTELHDGTFNIISETDKGTSIDIFLPCRSI